MWLSRNRITERFAQSWTHNYAMRTLRPQRPQLVFNMRTCADKQIRRDHSTLSLVMGAFVPEATDRARERERVRWKYAPIFVFDQTNKHDTKAVSVRAFVWGRWIHYTQYRASCVYRYDYVMCAKWVVYHCTTRGVHIVHLMCTIWLAMQHTYTGRLWVWNLFVIFCDIYFPLNV